MTRTFKTILLILTASLLLSDCRQKKLFGQIEVVGRLIHQSNSVHEPAAGVDISLKADNRFLSRSADDGSLELATVTTDAGGNFILKSRPAKAKTNSYYLVVKGQFVLKSFHPKENGVTDVGDIIAYY
jgi:hypothetical protein